MTEVKNTELKFNVATLMEAAVTNSSDGLLVNYDHDDQKILLIIGGGEATIKAGTGLQGTQDLVIPYESSKTKAVVLESGKYKQMSGANKGKVVITGSNVTVQAIWLP